MGAFVENWSKGKDVENVTSDIQKSRELCPNLRKLTDWFTIETGVRQGCVLSPILYAFFINGLVDELNEAKLGVEIKPGVLLDCLFYADDLVFLADNIIAAYAKKWRFELNPKKMK